MSVSALSLSSILFFLFFIGVWCFCQFVWSLPDVANANEKHKIQLLCKWNIFSSFFLFSFFFCSWLIFFFKCVRMLCLLEHKLIGIYDCTSYLDDSVHHWDSFFLRLHYQIRFDIRWVNFFWQMQFLSIFNSMFTFAIPFEMVHHREIERKSSPTSWSHQL